MRAAIAILAAILIAACGDTQVAGTSSGVDNPALTVSFRDAAGTALSVTGDLNVYSQDQNPAVDPEPLVTLKIRGASSTSLTGDDFARIAAGVSKRTAPHVSDGLSKSSAPAAAPIQGAEAPGPIVNFNLILKTQDRTGSLLLGFGYDSASKSFSHSGRTGLTRVDVKPRPLVRYQARVARESIHGDAGRMFVPGTPFLATLVDSFFIIEDMPEGTFPLRLLSGDGSVYPVKDSLDTRDSTRVYRPLLVPVGKVDSVGGKDSIPEIRIQAGLDHEAFLGQPSFLEGKIGGLEASDPRVSFLWTQIVRAGDSGRVDTMFKDTTLPPKVGPSPLKATIVSPTRLATEVRFPAEGVFEFQISATAGIRTRMDTVAISVRKLPPPAKPRIIRPQPGDSVVAGKTYNIQWEMAPGPVTVQVSVDSGGNWINLIRNKEGQPFLPWVPAKELGASRRCLIRVRNEKDSTMIAEMDGLFNLLQ